MTRIAASSAIAAALLVTLSTLLPEPVAAQGSGGAMPPNCTQNLNQCSLQVWTRNSFPRAGYQQSVTFSNGQTLTCTSNGANTPRTCTLSPNKGAALNSGGPDPSLTPPQNSNGQQPENQPGSQQANNQNGDQLNADQLSNLVSQVAAPHGGTTGTAAQCEQLSAQLDTLKQQPDPAANVPGMRAFFNTIMAASPGQIDKLIQLRQSVLKGMNANEVEVANQAGKTPPPPLQDPVLDWLLNYRTAQLAGIGMQDAKDQFLQQIDDANKQAKARRTQMQNLQNQMANLGCGAGP